ALDTTAQATPAVTPDEGNMNARSYGELLAPIPNAVAALQAADAAARDSQQQPTLGETGGVQVAGYHHHHHHHRVIRRILRPLVRHHHHHHHHHHHPHRY